MVKSLFSGISSGTERKTLLGEVPSFHKHWNKELRIYEDGKAPKTFPVSLGYETIAQVISVGKNVHSVKVGDLIWVDGPHAQYHVMNEEKPAYLLLPLGIDPQSAVFLPLTRVALGAVHDANIKVGDVVVVIGQGVVGSLVAQIARLNGATVVVVDVVEDRLELARTLGFETINAKKVKDPAVYLRTELGYKQGADTTIEASGGYIGLNSAIRMVGLQGKVVTVGSYPTASAFMNLGEEWQKNKISLISSMTINGCIHPGYPLWNLDRLNQTALHLLAKEKLAIKPLISHLIPFEEAKKAYDVLLNEPPIAMKIILTY